MRRKQFVSSVLVIQRILFSRHCCILTSVKNVVLYDQPKVFKLKYDWIFFIYAHKTALIIKISVESIQTVHGTGVGVTYVSVLAEWQQRQQPPSPGRAVSQLLPTGFGRRRESDGPQDLRLDFVPEPIEPRQAPLPDVVVQFFQFWAKHTDADSSLIFVKISAWLRLLPVFNVENSKY